ncbi:MAG: phosphatidate cytidylyltransferase [Thermoleophilia bacterium]|nr:phosphatidate cytidylyltransferase [Thermoleophilia bacterium]
MSGLLNRIAVAAVLLPVTLWLVWQGGLWLLALALVAGLFALHELYTLARSLRPLVLAGYVGLVLAVAGAAFGGQVWFLVGLQGALAAVFLLFLGSAARQPATSTFSVTMLGVVWVGGGLGSLLLLRDLEAGRSLVFTVLLTVFAADTAAFFVGRAIGRRRLAPAISPGKSLEGFVAGTLCGVAVSFVALYEQGVIGTWQAAMLGLVVALASVLGDLFESAVKRDLGAKDSGTLLGGHGGVLDRLDSLLWAGPAAYVALLVLS